MYYFRPFSIVTANYESASPSALMTFYYYVAPEVPHSLYADVKKIEDLDCYWILILGLWTSRCGRLHILFQERDSQEVTLLDVDTSNPYKKLYCVPCL